ncbi:MAG: hypothetical protein Q8878_06065 [Bacillota bacterium]|nr:hypothetical protein [Bacillota bacterium]
MNLKKTSALTLGSLFCAISVIDLYIAALLPTARLALTAAAGIPIAALLIIHGPGCALLSFAATAALSLMLLPDKTPAFLYSFFLGYYPVLKFFIEKIRKLPAELLLKILAFSLALAISLYISTGIAGIPKIFTFVRLPVFFAAANVVFIIYDFAFTLLIGWFKSRVVC